MGGISKNLSVAVGELDRQERILSKPSFSLTIGGFVLSWSLGGKSPSEGDQVLLRLSDEVYRAAISATTLEIEMISRQIFGEFTDGEFTDDQRNLDSSSNSVGADDNGYYRFDIAKES